MIWLKKYIYDFLSILGLIWLIIEFSSYFFKDYVSYIQNFCGFIITIIICLIISLIVNFPKKKIVFKIHGVDSYIIIQKGDLLDFNDDIVLSSSNFFNTDTNLISPNSLLSRYIKKHNLDENKIQKEILDSLKGLKATKSNVKKGNMLSFPVGSVASFERDTNHKVYLLAITRITDNGGNIKSHSDRLIVDKALTNLWEILRNINDNRSICMPVIGTGIGKSFQQNIDSILNICMSFINESKNKKICNMIKIVVRDSDYSFLEFEQLRNIVKYISK